MKQRHLICAVFEVIALVSRRAKGDRRALGVSLAPTVTALVGVALINFESESLKT